MNPWALIWANDRYYLYGYDVKETEGSLIERNYRVDKLNNIELSDLPRDMVRVSFKVSMPIPMFQEEWGCFLVKSR